MKKSFAILATVLSSAMLRAETVTSESAAFDFDSSDSSVLAAPLTIHYSPEWIGDGYAPGASVEIVALSHPGLFNVVTADVYTAGADVSGTTAYAPTDAAASLRLVMKVVKDDVVLGTLEKDVLVGTAYQSAQEVDVDTCADSLQRAVSAHPASIPVAYDLAWFAGATSVKLEVLNHLVDRSGTVTDTTNTLAVLTGPSGDYGWTDSQIDGTTILRLTPLGEGGIAVDDPILSPSVFLKIPRGLFLYVR